MKRILQGIILLSCSFTTSAQDFILPMGHQEPWTGKLLFNSEGGYNYDNATPSNSPIHAWEQLYEAGKGDVYTITMPTAAPNPAHGRVQFKTPITLRADHSYRIAITFLANQYIDNASLSLCENENDNNCLISSTVNLTANKKVTISRNGTGMDIADAKIALEFPTTKDDAVITLSAISIFGWERPSITGATMPTKEGSASQI